MTIKVFVFFAMALTTSLAISVPTASAAVVCNEDGDCWKVKKRYDYKPEFRLKIYDDDWTWDEKEDDRYRWREAHEGPGYYRDGVWIEF